MFTVKKTMDGLKKDVNELRCVEQKLSRQLELIQKPLAELGTDPVPNACTEVNSTGCVIFNEFIIKIFRNKCVMCNGHIECK